MKCDSVHRSPSVNDEMLTWGDMVPALQELNDEDAEPAGCYKLLPSPFFLNLLLFPSDPGIPTPLPAYLLPAKAPALAHIGIRS